MGLISYSWYLWHWPLMALLRVATGSDPTMEAMLGAALLSLILGGMSWLYIEQPFRRRTLPDTLVLKRYGAAMLAVAILPAAFWASSGLPKRVQAIETFGADPNGCITVDSASVIRSGPPCDIAGQDRVALIGDSHANSLAPAVRQAAAAHGAGFVQMTKALCLPLFDATYVDRRNPSHAGECLAFNAEVERRLMSDPSISTVVVAGYWGTSFSPLSPRHLEGHWAGAPTAPDALLQAAMIRTAARLAEAGLKVLVVGDTSKLRFDPSGRPYLEMLPARRWIAAMGDPYALAERSGGADLVEPEPGNASGLLKAATEGLPGVTFLDTRPRLCVGSRCRFLGPDGELLYLDEHHLSPAGAAAAFRPDDLP
jgi:hypothetical protein